MAFGATSEVNEKTYSGYTGSGPLTYPFSHTSVDDLNVEVGGVALPKSGWTFTGNAAEGGFDGGSITLVSAVTNTDVRIWRDMVRLRNTKIGVGGATSKDIDAELTRLVLMAQDAARDYAEVNTRIAALAADIAALDGVAEALPSITAVLAEVENADSNLNKAASVSALIQYIYDESQPGGSLAHIYDNRTDLARYVGYLPAVTYASLDGQVISDNRVTVTHDPGSGTATYALNADVLPYTVPTVFDASAWRLLELQSDVTQEDYDFLQSRLARLERLFPQELPRWRYTPTIDVAAGFVGQVFDFESYIVDSDSLIGEISIIAESLPTGLSLDGFILNANNPPVQAEAAYVLRVVDESGVYNAGQQQNPVGIEVYDTTPPSRPPEWETLPDLSFVRGNQMLAFAVTTYANDPGGDDGAIVYTVANLPDGITFNGTSLVGRPTAAAGVYTITWTATDEDTEQTNADQQITLVDPPAPDWDDIPFQAVERNTAIQTINYLAYVADENTVDGELVLSVSGNPNGTVFSNNQLSGAPTAEGTYQVDVTATNNAGLSTTKRHTITVTTPTSGSTGGDGGGFQTELD